MDLTNTMIVNGRSYRCRWFRHRMTAVLREYPDGLEQLRTPVEIVGELTGVVTCVSLNIDDTVELLLERVWNPDEYRHLQETRET